MPEEISTPEAARAQARPTYNYCGICGHQPKSKESPNYGPLKWWDPDDGWKIGSLCIYCHDDAFYRGPKPGDLAYKQTNGVADDINTDEDVIDAW